MPPGSLLKSTVELAERCPANRGGLWVLCVLSLLYFTSIRIVRHSGSEREFPLPHPESACVLCARAQNSDQDCFFEAVDVCGELMGSLSEIWNQNQPVLVCVFMNIRGPSPRTVARMAGGFYFVTFVAGITAMRLRGSLGVAAGVIAATAYVVVTLLFYWIFRPVNRGLSLLAAIISLAGCAIGPLSFAHVLPLRIHPLVFFGFYCALIGYLVWRSTFLPRVLGILMVFAGLGWLTFASTSLTRSLSPYNLVPGIIGEGALTLWLLLMGVKEAQWTERVMLDSNCR